MKESVIAEDLQRGVGWCETPEEAFTVVPEQEEEIG